MAYLTVSLLEVCSDKVFIYVDKEMGNDALWANECVFHGGKGVI